MSNQMRMYVALGLVAVALLLPKFEGLGVLPNKTKLRDTLKIVQPESKYLEKSKAADKVTSTNDRNRLCLFTYEFAARVPKYETSAQSIQDVYAHAAKELFGTELNDKYPEIGNLVGKGMLESILGDKDGFVSTEVREELSKQFSATAWVLGD